MKARGRNREEELNFRSLETLSLITDIIMNGEYFEEDEVHSAYAAAYNLSEALKTKLPLLKNDPFLLWSRRFDKKKIALYAKQVQMQRARLNRLITSTISMDTLIRLGIQTWIWLSLICAML